MSDKILPAEWAKLSAFIAETMGLEFPATRWPDLHRGIAAAARQLEFSDTAALVHRLLAGPASSAQQEALAVHLTVGETYFLREIRSFHLLTERIIPELVQQRRQHDQRLRIWCAACCTGEEAYSLAITLRTVIPDIDDWEITLLATDINPHFLRKADAGVFGKWAFRDVPAGFRESHFKRLDDNHWEILPCYRRMVRFAPLNLVTNAYPSLASGLHDIDIIFCRNVLMYFSPAQAHRVIEKLHAAQSESAWLIVGAGELSQVASTPYVSSNLNGVTHFRKLNGPAPVPQLPALPIAMPQPLPDPEPVVYVAPAPPPPAPPQPTARPPRNPDRWRRTARLLADRGRLDEALQWCDRWVAADQLNPSGHYLRAVILQEKGDIDQAVRALRGALYLEPRMVLAHVALGHIARNRGRRTDAEKHLGNARRLLDSYSPGDVLPESEGVTAAHFIRIVDSLLEREAAA